MDDRDLRLLKLYGITRGYLKYLPVSIPVIRNVKGLLEDVFFSALIVYEVQGRKCLDKEQIQKGIRRRVIRLLGNKCVVCDTTINKNMHVHHIKPYWRAWNNPFGFTVLCEECHEKAHGTWFSGYSIELSADEAREICQKISSPQSQEYDPPHPKNYPEPTIVQVRRYLYAL